MAITVRDIQEKEFFTQETGGYNIEQVDDFLDEIAEQMGVLIRENLELNEQLRQLDGELQAAKQAAAEAEAKTPDYNEKDYFSNLQNAMRESLIGAQRIADETIGEANQKAQKMVGEAQAEAEKLSAESKAQAEALVANAGQGRSHHRQCKERDRGSRKPYRRTEGCCKDLQGRFHQAA